MDDPLAPWDADFSCDVSVDVPTVPPGSLFDMTQGVDLQCYLLSELDAPQDDFPLLLPDLSEFGADVAVTGSSTWTPAPSSPTPHSDDSGCHPTDSMGSNSSEEEMPAPAPRVAPTRQQTRRTSARRLRAVPTRLAAADRRYSPFIRSLTDRERQLLEDSGHSLPEGDLTRREERETRRILRKLKNKASAQESRRRKKQYMEGLERRIRSRDEENTALHERISHLETHNTGLLAQLKRFKAQFGFAADSGGAGGGAMAGTILCVLVLSLAMFFPTTGTLRTTLPMAADAATTHFRGRTLLAFDTTAAPVFGAAAEPVCVYAESVCGAADPVGRLGSWVDAASAGSVAAVVNV